MVVFTLIFKVFCFQSPFLWFSNGEEKGWANMGTCCQFFPKNAICQMMDTSIQYMDIKPLLHSRSELQHTSCIRRGGAAGGAGRGSRGDRGQGERRPGRAGGGESGEPAGAESSERRPGAREFNPIRSHGMRIARRAKPSVHVPGRLKRLKKIKETQEKVIIPCFQTLRSRSPSF